jgi:cytochrome c biogenesis protein CcdA
VGPTLGAASVLAAQGKDLVQVALTMLVFGIGAAMPLVLLGFASREAMMHWRGRLMGVGTLGKTLLGTLLILLGIFIVTGLDKRSEALLVDLSPTWLTNLTTQF